MHSCCWLLLLLLLLGLSLQLSTLQCISLAVRKAHHAHRWLLFPPSLLHIDLLLADLVRVFWNGHPQDTCASAFSPCRVTLIPIA
jgi:hypothetical protein